MAGESDRRMHGHQQAPSQKHGGNEKPPTSQSSSLERKTGLQEPVTSGRRPNVFDVVEAALDAVASATNPK